MPGDEETLDQAQKRLEEKRRLYRGEQLEVPGTGVLGGALANVPTPRLFLPEEPPECDQCDDRGWIVEPGQGVGSSGTAKRCPCTLRSRREDRLAACDVPERYRGLGIDSFTITVSDQQVKMALMSAKAKAQQYLKRFISLRSDRSGPFRESGLLLQGPPGSGKTHLACALLQDLIRQYGVRGMFVDFTQFLYEVKATYDANSQTSSSAMIGRAANAEVLVVDELGAQKPTAHTLEVLYLMLNGRHNRRQPTLFTSNYYLATKPGYEASALDSRLSSPIISRLHGVCHVVTFPDYDYRRQVQTHGTRP